MSREPPCTFVVSVSLALSLPVASVAETLLDNAFPGTAVRASTWHIPFWFSTTDGTLVGKTQFRVSQNSQLPTIVAVNATITLETYNPTGNSFYGTDLISNQTFSLQAG
jgi:hypothetical protein